MATKKSVEDLLTDEIKDLYSAGRKAVDQGRSKNGERIKRS